MNNRAAFIVITAVFILTAPALSDPIHDAARKGDKAKVASLLDQNPDLVFSRDKLGFTPLHIAVQAGKADVAALLLDSGADVNARVAEVHGARGLLHSYGETPLTLAIIPFHHTRMIDLLISRGADPNATLWDGVTPLFRAVQLDHPYDVELLLADGADLNARDINGRTPLHWAAMIGKADLVQLLLDHNANPSAKDFYGSTPASYASEHLFEKVAALIRARGGH